jgi:hypothetical protein
MKRNIVLIFSWLSLIYFTSLFYISYNRIILGNIFEAIGELFSIPFTILIIVLFVISLKRWYSEKWSIKSASFFSIIVLIVTITLIIAATIFNI